MMFEQGPKTIGITKEQVWEAWKRIKRGGRGVGVDQVTIEMIEQNPRKYLYPVWNRLASGSYFPPPVREVSIPKSNGKERLLGVPTLRDRVAQEVIREELEKELEPLFHPSSYGYRPGKSAKHAIDACKEHCWKTDYVVDVDIKGFFDIWIQAALPGVEFERYADDIVIHTKSMNQSAFVLDKLRQRLKEYGLELSEEKTKIVHCNKPSRRQGTPPGTPVSFDFLGFTFKPRQSKRTDGIIFWGYGPGVSQKNLKRMNAEVKLLHRRVGLTVYELAAILAPKLRGWISYYGSVRKSALARFFDRLNIRLAKWVACKYKITSKWACFAWLIRLGKMQPTLFEHWKYGWLP